MVIEKTVKYSEKEGKGEVSYQSVKKALGEMKIDLPITEQDVRKIQRPERVLDQNRSIGAPSKKNVKENITSLREKMRVSRDWLIFQKRKIKKAKDLVLKMEEECER